MRRSRDPVEVQNSARQMLYQYISSSPNFVKEVSGTLLQKLQDKKSRSSSAFRHEVSDVVDGFLSQDSPSWHMDDFDQIPV